MEEQLLILARNNNSLQLQEFLDSQESEQIADLVLNQLMAENFYSGNDSDVLALLRTIFFGSPVEKKVESKATHRRRNIILRIIEWLCSKGDDSSTAIDKMATDLVNFLVNEMDGLPESVVTEATTCITETVRTGQHAHGKLFEFLPKCLSILGGCATVMVLTGTAHAEVLSGVDFVDFILNRMCSSRWHPSTVVSMASVFGDINMTPKQSEFVVDKLTRQLSVLDVNEVPPLIYQLLLLSRKGHKRLILKGISDHFNKLDKEITEMNDGQRNENDDSIPALSFKQLAHMEGTVILHMCFAIKQDQDLGSEFIKFIKAGKTSYLTPFNVACLLSIARIHRFEDAVLDFMKTAVLTSFKDAERLNKAPWIAESSRIEATPITSIIQQIIKKTSFGWDQATQSLVQLGILIIDSFVPPAAWGKGTGAISIKKGAFMSPNDHACDLGVRILLEVFKIHDMVRTEILDQILSRIVSRSNSVMHFLVLLELIVTECPQTLLQYLPRIKETLDYLSFLPLATAEHLMKAIRPVIHLNSSFRDGLMLVLRKGMFAKDVEGRRIALSGFMQLLKIPASHVQFDGPSQRAFSQTGASSRSAVADTQALSLEILGMLRRCFSQQPEIRIALYDGLAELTLRRPELNSVIFEILYPQFLKYYEADTGISAPIRVDLCVENALSGGVPRVLEPVYALLSSLCNAIVLLSSSKSADADNVVDSQQLADCEAKLVSLVQRLTKADMEDYELDKSADYNMGTNVGSRNNLYACLLLGCYEAMMEYTFRMGNSSVESSETILKLFKKFKQLFDVLKEKSVTDKGRKSTVSMADHSILSLECLTRLCQFAFVESGDHNQARVILRADADFVKYLTSVTQSHLSKLASITENPEELIYKHCVSLAEVFMEEFISNGNEDVATSQTSNLKDKKDKGKSILSIAIECFDAILHVVINCWPEKLADFIAIVVQAQVQREDVNLNDLLEVLIKKFQELVVVFTTERPPLYREAAYLLQGITLLSKQIEKASGEPSRHVDQLIVWIDKFSVEHAIEDNSIAKPVVILLVQLARDLSNFKTIEQLAQDVFAIAGSIELPPGEEELEYPDPHFSIVNGRTSYIVAGSVLSFLEQSYDELEWCLAKLKFSITVLDPESATQEMMLQRHVFENQIYQRMQNFMTINVHIEKSRLIGSTAEHLFRTVQKAYKVLLAMTKYNLVEPTKVSKHFVNVIILAGGDLTTWMYKFLTIYGASEEGTADANRKKGKGKGKATVNTKQKAKIMRESKMIPNLIFVVEQFERYLIQLGKKSKVNFMQYMKRSTARDFRIKVDQLQEMDQESDEDDDDPKNVVNAEDMDVDNPSANEDENEDRLEDRRRKRPRV